MRRVRALLIALAVAGGLVIAAPATAAFADSLRNVYYYNWNCNSYGTFGVQNGLWPSYHCDFLPEPGPEFPEHGLWFLYA